jgi:hypothetical protein
MRRGTCVHYTGMQTKVCEAGVNYEEVFGKRAGIACRAPCLQEYKTHERIDGKMQAVWKPWPRRGEQEIPCSLRLMPTEEQIAAANAEWATHMEKMAKVMEVVRPWRTWKKTNRVAKQEVIECPACKGRLHLTQAAYNGHVWGKCETADCVSWME